jgi:hypothetical protein
MEVKYPTVLVEDAQGNLFEAYRVRYPDGRIVHLDKALVDLHGRPYREVELQRVPQG